MNSIKESRVRIINGVRLSDAPMIPFDAMNPAACQRWFAATLEHEADSVTHRLDWQSRENVMLAVATIADRVWVKLENELLKSQNGEQK